MASAHLAPVDAAGAVLLDIEGTVAPIAFVKETLFPYARQRLAAYVTEHADDPVVAAQIAEVTKLIGGARPDVAAAVHTLIHWSDEDRKVTPLKTLQGLIWRAGYESGAIRAPVFDDAVQQLHAWRARGVPMSIYSSGSVAAQKLLFRYSNYGDLTSLFAGHYDTTTGSKLEAQSYADIAADMGRAPAQITFFSDHVGELQAAARAGMRAVRLERAGEVPPTDEPWGGATIATFSGL